MVPVMADGWCGNKKDVGEIDGIWWKDKGWSFSEYVNIVGGNLCIYEKNGSANVLSKW